MAGEVATVRGGRGERDARETSLRACWLLAGNLALLTVGIAVYYAGEEPFPALQARSLSEEAYALSGFAYAFTYLGVGSLTVLGWGALSAYLLRRTFRGPRSLNVRVLIVISLLATWIATWTPRAYIEDLKRVQQRIDQPAGR
jgi:hypothetical protein